MALYPRSGPSVVGGGLSGVGNGSGYRTGPHARRSRPASPQGLLRLAEAIINSIPDGHDQSDGVVDLDLDALRNRIVILVRDHVNVELQAQAINPRTSRGGVEIGVLQQEIATLRQQLNDSQSRFTLTRRRLADKEEEARRAHEAIAKEKARCEVAVARTIEVERRLRGASEDGGLIGLPPSARPDTSGVAPLSAEDDEAARLPTSSLTAASLGRHRPAERVEAEAGQIADNVLEILVSQSDGFKKEDLKFRLKRLILDSMKQFVDDVDVTGTAEDREAMMQESAMFVCSGIEETAHNHLAGGGNTMSLDHTSVDEIFQLIVSGFKLCMAAFATQSNALGDAPASVASNPDTTAMFETRVPSEDMQLQQDLEQRRSEHAHFNLEAMADGSMSAEEAPRMWVGSPMASLRSRAGLSTGIQAKRHQLQRKERDLIERTRALSEKERHVEQVRRDLFHRRHQMEKDYSALEQHVEQLNNGLKVAKVEAAPRSPRSQKGSPRPDESRHRLFARRRFLGDHATFSSVEIWYKENRKAALSELMRLWYREAVHAIMYRKRVENTKHLSMQRRQHEQEIIKLKKVFRDEEAVTLSQVHGQMAFHDVRCARYFAQSFGWQSRRELLRAITFEWSRVAKSGTANKRVCELRFDRDRRISGLRQARLERGGYFSEKMAEAFFQRHLQTALKVVISAWREETRPGKFLGTQVETAFATQDEFRGSKQARTNLTKGRLPELLDELEHVHVQERMLDEQGDVLRQHFEQVKEQEKHLEEHQRALEAWCHQLQVFQWRGWSAYADEAYRFRAHYLPLMECFTSWRLVEERTKTQRIKGLAKQELDHVKADQDQQLKSINADSEVNVTRLRQQQATDLKALQEKQKEKLRTLRHRKDNEIQELHNHQQVDLDQAKERTQHVAVQMIHLTAMLERMHVQELLVLVLRMWRSNVLLAINQTKQEALARALDSAKVELQRSVRFAKKGGKVEVVTNQLKFVQQVSLLEWHRIVVVDRLICKLGAMKSEFMDEKADVLKQIRARVGLSMNQLAIRNQERLLAAIIASCFSRWRDDARHDSFARIAAQRFQMTEELYEEDIERLVYLQAGRTDALSRRLYIVRKTVGDLALAQWSFHALDSHSRGERVKRDVEENRRAHEDQLALLVRAQEKDRILIKEERARFCVRYLEKPFVCKYFHLLLHCVVVAKLQTANEVMDASFKQSLDATVQRLNAILDGHGDRAGKFIETRTRREWMMILVYNWFRVAKRMRVARRTNALKEDLRTELKVLKTSMNEQIEALTVILRTEIERLGCASYVQIIFNEWQRAAGAKIVYHKVNVALAKQKEHNDAQLVQHEREWSSKNLASYDKAMFLLHRQAQDFGTRLVFRAWGEALVRARYTEAVGRFHDDAITHKQKFQQEMNKIRTESEEYLNRVLTWIDGLQQKAVRELLLLAVVQFWRRGTFVTKQEHRRRCSEVYDEVMMFNKKRVLYIGELLVRGHELRLMFRVWLIWQMFVREIVGGEDHRLQLVAKEAEKSRFAKQIAQSFADRLLKLFETLSNETRWLLRNMCLHAWRQSLTSARGAFMISSLEGKVAQLKSEVWHANDKWIAVTSKIPRKMLLSRSIAVWMSQVVLKRATDEHHEQEMRQYNAFRDELRSIEAKKTLERKYILDSVSEFHSKLQNDHVLSRWCSFMFASWRARTSSAKDQRDEAKQRERDREHVRLLRVANNQLSESYDRHSRYAEWVYECGVIVMGLRCLYLWRILAINEAFENQMDSSKREADSRIIGNLQDAHSFKKAAGWKAAQVLVRIKLWALLQVVWNSWVGHHRKDTLDAALYNEQRKMRVTMDQYQQDSSLAFNKLRTQMQLRWADSKLKTQRVEGRVLSTRAFIIWAMSANSTDRVGGGYAELMDNVRQQRQEVVASGIIQTQLPQLRSHAYGDRVPQLAWVHPTVAGPPLSPSIAIVESSSTIMHPGRLTNEADVESAAPRTQQGSAEAVRATLARLAKARELLEQTESLGVQAGSTSE